jgi:carbon storage regulator CsrA
MLVLTRRLMERICIGQDIWLTVVRLENGQVRLGIDAPREVPIRRAELIPGSVPASRVSLRPPVRRPPARETDSPPPEPSR